MSVEGISEGDVVGFECAELFEEENEVEKIDLKIYSHARPSICTAFDHVKRIDPSRVVVVLSDGSKWEIQSEKAFETISEDWKAGDDIRVDRYADGKNCEFVMKNAREKSVYLAQLCKECDDLSKAFFLSKVDETGYALRTNDGKLWVVGYWGSFGTQHWREGDRVILNKSTHSSRYEDYHMINPRTMGEVWVTQVFTDESQ